MDADAQSVEELQEQVAYLKAFGQACRVQLRSYLEALLTDVEKEWGRADPAALPQGSAPRRPRSAPAATNADRSATFESNTTSTVGRGRAPTTTSSRWSPSASERQR